MMIEPVDSLKLGLGFLNAFAGGMLLVTDLSSVEKGVCTALVAACGFGLLFLNKLGAEKTTKSKPVDVDKMTRAQRNRLRVDLRSLASKDGVE